MSKTMEYVLIGGGVLVVGYLVLKSKSTTPVVPITAVPVTAANSSTVQTTAINDAANLLNNIL